MKRFMKSSLAVVLCFIMLIGIMPMGAFAENEKQGLAAENEIRISDETVMGRIVNNTLSTVSDENANFSISYIEVSEKVATVSISNETACKLVVAIYDPDTNQMLGSGIKEIESNAGSVDVEIEISTMPEYFVVRAFALDSNMSAVCDKYESFHYTKEFEEFYEKTPDDFDASDVIIMQDDTSGYEDEEIDFGVLIDDAIVEKSSSEMTIEYDNDTETYSFFNATDKVKNLKSGDVYYFQYGENNTEFIVIKAESVTTEGNNVYIKENPEIGLADVFSYLKIDSYGDYDNAEISDVGEGITIDDETISTQSFNYDDNKFSKDVSIKIDVHDKNNLGSITGAAKVSFSASAKCYYDAVLFGKDYYELKIETKISVSGSVTVSGKVDILKNMKFFDESLYVGVFDLEATIKPEFSISGSVAFEFSLSKKVTITSDSNNKSKKTEKSDDNFKPDGDVSASVTIKIGLNVTIKFALYIPPHGKDLAKKTKIKYLKDAYEEIASVSITLSAGFKGTLKTEDITPTHPCELCAFGTISMYAGLSGKLKITIVPKIIDFSVDINIASYEKPLWDLYWSKTATPHFAIGECGTISCPNKYYKVTIKVVDSNLKPLSDVVLTADGGMYDFDEDEQYDDDEDITDNDGVAIVYLKKGQHTITLKYKENTETKVIKVLALDKSEVIKFSYSAQEEPDYPDDPTDPDNPNASDGTGSDDKFSNIGTQGGIIQFGSYPQTDVTSSMGTTLNSKASGWKSYKYYEGTGYGTMHESDYMYYCDVTYGNNKYRGVKFNTYRPYWTEDASTTSCRTNQDDNGYTVGNTYWFKYEPIKWRVLDPTTGLVLSDAILDSQAYNNYIISGGTDEYSKTAYWGDSAKTYYANNYAKSSIRQWLNNEFYNTAFSANQQSKIQSTTLDNSAYSTSYSAYDSASTTDKIFLLSYAEVHNTTYGFTNSTSSTDTRTAKGSDYAKCQGLYVYSSNGNSYWRLRSAGNRSNGTCSVHYDGYVYSLYPTDDTNYGVRAALKLNLKSLTTQSDAGTQAEKEGTGNGYKYNCSACEAGGEYILLNVTSYGSNFTLSTQNLEYIDQLTADENGKVEGSFIPRNAYSNSTTLLIGDFGNGIEAKKLTVTENSDIPDVEIKNYQSSISVDYKSTLTFHTDIDAPDGYKIVWSNGQEGNTCTLSNVTEKEYKVSAKLVKISDGSTVKESKIETVSVNTGFFAKLAAFFRGLFKSLPVYVDNKKQ